MTSKIEGYSSSQPLVGVAGKSGKHTTTVKSSEDSSDGTSSTDQLTLTSSARNLQKLAAAVAAAPIVNEAKVASTKLAISNGTYQVNSRTVADKILQSDSKLK